MNKLLIKDQLAWDKFFDVSSKRETYPPKKIELFNRLVAYTNNFFVVAAIGAISPGYLMIITKELIPSISMVADEYIDELRWLIEVTSEATALNNIEGMEISNIYPNPANNKLFIPIALDRSDNVSIEIYNMIGIKLSENNMNLGIGNHMIMKDIDLNSGQYIVVIRDKNGTAINTQQLVIVK